MQATCLAENRPGSLAKWPRSGMTCLVVCSGPKGRLDALADAASAVLVSIPTGAENPCAIGNLLALFSEPQDDKAEPVAAAMQALARLINRGALIHA
jgi:hypothetical protein